MDLMDKHIADGGYGGWFPEGTINPEDPHKVRQFRAGGLMPAVKHDVEIWCLANVGNSVFWPKRASVGGRPCKIGYKFIRICESSKEFLAAVEADKDGDAKAAKSRHLANEMQRQVQEAVDALVKAGYKGA